MKRILLLSVLSLFFTSFYAQDIEGQGSVKLVNADGYITHTKLATFHFEDLSGRAIINLPSPEYITREKVDIRYRIMVNPDGEVIYVRAINKDYPEALLKSGISSLYTTEFGPSENFGKAQTIHVTITFKPVE